MITLEAEWPRNVKVEVELAAATAKLAAWPPMGFHLNPDIRSMLGAAVDAAEVSVHVMQCYYSDERLNYALIHAIRDRGVTVGFTLHPSSTRSSDAVNTPTD